MQWVKWASVGLLSVSLGVSSSFADQVRVGREVSEPGGAAANSNVNVETNANNTAKNKRDRENATLTPADQGDSKTDREMTAKIRRAVVHNKQLSVIAKNIKIITVNGKVTLRGPVKTAQERSIIDGIVQQAGPGSLDNQLEVEKQ